LRGVRRPEVLFAALRWLLPHDLSTPEEAPDGSAAHPMGDAPVPKRGRSADRRGSGISGGVRRLSGVGFADRGGKLPGRLAPAGRDAGATLVVGVRRDAVRAPPVAAGLKPSDRRSGTTRDTLSRRSTQLRATYQRIVSGAGSRGDALRVRPLVSR